MRGPNAKYLLLSALTLTLCNSALVLPLQPTLTPTAQLRLKPPPTEQSETSSTRRLLSTVQQDPHTGNIPQLPPSSQQMFDQENDYKSVSSTLSPSDDDIIKNYRPQSKQKTPKFAKLKSPLRKTSRVAMPNEGHHVFKPNQQDSNADQNNLEGRLPRISIFSVIQPVLAAALTPDKSMHPNLPAKVPISRVEYKSSPLKGTESRDRRALGLSADLASSGLAATQQHPSPQESTHSSFGIQERMTEPPFIQPEHDFEKNDRTSSQIHLTSTNDILTAIPTSSAPAQSEYTSYEQIRQFETDSSQHEENNKTVSSTNANPHVSALRNSNRMFWGNVIDHIRQTIEKLKAPKETEPSLFRKAETQSKNREDVYTEEDLNTMIDNIMSEIQMRSEDAQAHRKMLKDYNRWSANDDTGGGPLMLQSKVLVNPEIVAEALAHSTKKLILSRHPQPSRDATIELLRAVQVKLVELLQPTM